MKSQILGKRGNQGTGNNTPFITTIRLESRILAQETPVICLRWWRSACSVNKFKSTAAESLMHPFLEYFLRYSTCGTK